MPWPVSDMVSCCWVYRVLSLNLLIRHVCSEFKWLSLHAHMVPDRVNQFRYVDLWEISWAVGTYEGEDDKVSVMVDCLLSMAWNGPHGTLIEAESNNPGVVPFNHCEKRTGEVVVFWLCPTGWNRLTWYEAAKKVSLTKLISPSLPCPQQGQQPSRSSHCSPSRLWTW